MSVKGCKGRRHIRRANHAAVVRREDGVILILSRQGIAVIPALTETVFEKLPTEIPTAGPLTEIPSQGADISDLGNGDLTGRLGEKGKFSNQRRGRDVAQGHRGSDP